MNRDVDAIIADLEMASEGPDELEDAAPVALERLRPGGSFVLDAPEGVQAVWGSGDEVLWAAGEPMLLVGPTGVGKTTLVGQLVAGRLGLNSELLGLPIRPGKNRVLYCAMDRPQQIGRALRRLFGPEQRQVLDERLIVWPGPLPADLGRKPETLAWLARLADADTLILDSLKDAAVKLTDDEAGGNLNRAIQTAIVDGVEVAGLHHQRKGQGGARPTTLEDVYGSTWITAGAGSVVLLWGTAGDALVDLRHLKQPAGEVGPLRIEHDHATGRSTIERGFDLIAYLRHRPRGATSADVARAMLSKDTPTDNENRKARRRLDQLVGQGLAKRDAPTEGGPGGTTAARYYGVETDPTTLIRRAS